MAGGFTTTFLTGASALGTSLTAGLFFGFSALVMPALDKATQADAIAVMQEINRIAVRSALMPLMFGTAILCVLAVVTSLRADRPVAIVSLAAATIYLVGVIGVTIVANVPLNDRLAALPALGASPNAWQVYSAPWTFWNSVRAFAGTLSAIGWGAALLLLCRSGS